MGSIEQMLETAKALLYSAKQKILEGNHTAQNVQELKSLETDLAALMSTSKSDQNTPYHRTTRNSSTPAFFLNDSDRKLYTEFVNDRSALDIEYVLHDENDCGSLDDEKTPSFKWVDLNSDTKPAHKKAKIENVANWASDMPKIEKVFEIQSNIGIADRLFDDSYIGDIDLKSIMHTENDYQRSSGSIFCGNDKTPTGSKLI